ncbi:hypothetical protein BC941DRAFT_402874 [Chlamydoabsidia padenii]|nr:hypothetical protein BC941DRAFT_402874 [Chlamydoabsidia padenii]
MPAPLEYNNMRRMSTITAPTNDIDFDAYDFQLCRPQMDIKDTFESRELEASYCRDFACCGLILTDLHDLLQHYEECHVSVEEEDYGLYNEEDEFDGTFIGTPPFDDGAMQLQSQIKQQQPDEEVVEAHDDLDIDLLKKRAAAYLTDICQHPSDYNNLATSLITTYTDDDHSTDGNCDNSKQETRNKKRSYDMAMMDHMAQNAAKRFALAAATSGTYDDSIPSSSIGLYLTDQELLAHAGVLLASSSHHSNQNADKPYKCPVQGCEKAYKNPNGLKYHNQHGHCSLTTDENENVASKPYQCALGGCGKRYKNLNGLKYHIEHSHVVALNHTLATFGSSYLIQQQQYQSSSSPVSSTPSLSPSSSPELSCLSIPF